MTSYEIDRRSLLVAGAAGAGTAGAGTAALGVTTDNAAAAAGPGERYFRHGVASGDPHPRSVILWTRATPTAAATPG